MARRTPRHSRGHSHHGERRARGGGGGRAVGGVRSSFVRRVLGDRTRSSSRRAAAVRIAAAAAASRKFASPTSRRFQRTLPAPPTRRPLSVQSLVSPPRPRATLTCCLLRFARGCPATPHPRPRFLTPRFLPGARALRGRFRGKRFAGVASFWVRPVQFATERGLPRDSSKGKKET